MDRSHEGLVGKCDPMHASLTLDAHLDLSMCEPPPDIKGPHYWPAGILTGPEIWQLKIGD